MSFLLSAHAQDAPTRQLTLEQSQEIVKLNGDWKLTNPEGQQLLTTVPQPWEKTYPRRMLPHYGKGSYELNLELPPQAVGKYFKLYTRIVGGESFRCYVNGELLGHNGFKLGSTSRTVEFSPFKAEQQTLKIRFEIENHFVNISGLTSTVLFGPAQQIETMQIKEQIALNLVIGVLVFLGFFHLLLFAGFPQDKALLFFAFFCLAMGLFGEFFQVRALEYFLGNFSMEVGARLTRFSMFLVCPAYFWYAYSAAPVLPGQKSYLSRRFVWTSTAISLVAILGLALPLRLSTLVMVAWLGLFFVLILISVIQLRVFIGMRSAYTFVFGCLVFSLGLFNDLLNGLGLLSNGNLARFGILVFCLLQAVFLALRLQSSYQQALRLQLEMQEVNQNLEGLVSNRTQEMQAKNEELQKLVRFKDEMSQMIVHDLKAPLQSLMNLPAQQSGLSEHARSSFESASRRIFSLVENMLQIKRTDNPELELRLRTQNLRSLSENVLVSVQNWAQSKKITIFNQVDPELKLSVDGPLLERVLLNLCDNAIKHTPIGGQIRVSSQQQADELQLLIEDNGHGLTAEILAKAFEQHQSFAQGQTPRSSGLGLHFCRQVIEAHGGKIRLENRSEGGTRAVISLPLSPEPETLPWSPEQLSQLAPIAAQLARVEVYEISSIQAVLQTLATSEPRVQAWKQALEQAIREVNEEVYAELLAQINKHSRR